MGQGRSRGGRNGRDGHQGRGGQGGRFNRPAYTQSIRNFNGEAENVGAVLRTTDDQIETKYQCMKFR